MRTRPVTMFVALMLPLMIHGCMMTGSAAIPRGATFCEIARPIHWSREDTIPTVKAVKEHNAAGKKLCGWK